MNLTVPLLVQEHKRPGTGKPLFVVRPLFVERPAEADEELGRAIAKLARTLRRDLDAMGRQPRHDELADWTFNPELDEHAVDTTIELRKQTAALRFLAVSLEALDRRLAFVPAVPDLWFEVPRGSSVKERARDVVREFLLKQEREWDDSGKFPVPAVLTRAVRGWVSAVELDVHPNPNLDKPDLRGLLSLGGAEKADGRQELLKVGRCLDWQFPDDLGRAILRDAEVAELQRLLAAPDRRPVLLVGRRRAGKTAVVHECVYRRVARRQSPHVAQENVWLLAPQRLISGMMYVGQWEDRLLAILDEAERRDHVLYFDDLLGLYQAGVSAGSDLTVAHVMRPHVERQRFRMLGEITPEALRVLREMDRGFADLFHVLPVEETPEPKTRQVLIHVMRELEGRHGCRFDLDALPAATDLQRRYVRELADPGRAAGFVRDLAVKHRKAAVGRRRVLEDFHDRSGLSVAFLDTAERLRREDVVAALSAQLVGQGAAVAAMADSVTVAKARLNDPGRPLASMLFLGPTGVGKTQAAKALAAYLFGDAQRLVRFDMNEYVEPGAAARLTGTFREPEGLLTSMIRRQPFAVLLLDEIEKADPGVFDLLLQVLGEGRLTDALGRTADFTNCIVVMTSNLGVRESGSRFGLRAVAAGSGPAGSGPGADGGIDRQVFVSAAERFFRPEFFNRIDRVVPFDPLSRDDVGRIARMLIADVFRRDGLVHRRCALVVEPEAMQRIVREGYHPQLGARALKRSIERSLTRPVAARLAAMAHDAPAVITLYARGDASRGGGSGGGDDGAEVAAHVEPLVEAPRSAAAAPEVDFDDPGDALDRIEDAVTRVERDLEALQTERELRQDRLSSAQFRYLALREHARHLHRQIERIDRLLHQARASTRAVANPKVRAARKRVVTRPVRSGSWGWKDLVAAEDVHARIAELVADAGEPIEEVDASLVELAQDAALLEAMAAGGVPDRCLVIIRSLSDHAATGQRMLADAYVRAFDARFHHFTASRVDAATAERLAGEPVDLLTLEMPGGSGIFSGEHGTHVFIPAHAATVPVQVLVQPLAAEEDALARATELFGRRAAWRAAIATGSAPAGTGDPFRLAPVVRVYDELNAAVDLRTGAVSRPPVEEMRRLILAALPAPAELRV